MRFFKVFRINRLKKQLKVLQQTRLNNDVSREALQREISIYVQLAKIYESLKGSKKFLFAHDQALACYRMAASLEDVNSQFILGSALLDEAKLRDSLQTEGIFNSASNELFMNELYKEAHAFLYAAEEHQHINAKRLRGLCYINGWGVPVDKDKGFDLVVASIEQENSWDRVQKIFKQLGINNSQFFSELFKHRS